MQIFANFYWLIQKLQPPKRMYWFWAWETFMYWNFQENILYVRIWPTSGSNFDAFKVAFLRSIVALIDISTWAHEVLHSLHPNTCKVKVVKAQKNIFNNKGVEKCEIMKICININCRYLPKISFAHRSFNWINYPIRDNWLVHIVRFWTTLFALQYTLGYFLLALILYSTIGK